MALRQLAQQPERFVRVVFGDPSDFPLHCNLRTIREPDRYFSTFVGPPSDTRGRQGARRHEDTLPNTVGGSLPANPRDVNQ